MLVIVSDLCVLVLVLRISCVCLWSSCSGDSVVYGYDFQAAVVVQHWGKHVVHLWNSCLVHAIHSSNDTQTGAYDRNLVFVSIWMQLMLVWFFTIDQSTLPPPLLNLPNQIHSGFFLWIEKRTTRTSQTR